MARDLRIRVTTVGTERVRAALRGIARETAQASSQRQRATRSTTAAVVSGARQEERAVAQAVQRSTTAAQRSAAARQRAARQTADVGVREARREADGVIREQRRAERRPARRGGGGSGGTLGAAAGAGLVGGVTAAWGTVERYAGAGGARSLEQLTAERADRRQRLIRLRNQMGGTQSIEDIDSQVQRTARSTGVSQDDLTRGLETAQARFANAPSVLANLDSMARVSQTTGASFDDVVGTMGTAQSAFGLDEAGTRQFAGMMVDAGNRGSIDAAQLAASFAPALGSIQRGTQMGGIGGAAQALGLAETMGMGQATASESATMSTRLVESLNDRRTQARLRHARVSVTDARGQLLPLEQIVENMAGSRLATDQGLLQRTFTNEEARQGAGIVMSQFNRDPEAVRSLFNVQASAGDAYVAQTAAEMDADESSKFLRQGINQEAAFVAGGQEAQTMETMAQLGTNMTVLTSQYPLATEALGVFTSAVQSAGGALAFLSLLGGGGGGLGGLLGGGAAGGGAAAAGGAGLMAMLPMLLGGGAIAATGVAGVMEYQRLSAEQNRRKMGEQYLGQNPGAVTPELLANVTGDASLIGPDAQRRDAASSRGRGAARTMEELRGTAAPAAPTGILSMTETRFAEVLSTAVATGAREGIEGRERGDAHGRGRSSAGHTR